MSQSLNEYMVQCMIDVMAREGIGSDLAQSIASEVEKNIRVKYGTDRHYIPAPSKQSRNQDIAACWRNGMSRADIAKRAGVAQRTVDRVISNQNMNQSGGFGRDEWNL